MILAALAIFAIIMTQTPLLSKAREKGEKVHTAAREYRTQASRQREDRRQKRRLAAEAREKQMKKQKTERELEEISKNSEFSQQSIPDFIIERNDSQPEEAGQGEEPAQRRGGKASGSRGGGAGSGSEGKSPPSLRGRRSKRGSGISGRKFLPPTKKNTAVTKCRPFLC